MRQGLQPYAAGAATLCVCRLDGEAALGDVLLREADLGEALARGDADLRLHEIDSRDDLGHGVLHLGGGRGGVGGEQVGKLVIRHG